MPALQPLPFWTAVLAILLVLNHLSVANAGTILQRQNLREEDGGALARRIPFPAPEAVPIPISVPIAQQQQQQDQPTTSSSSSATSSNTRQTSPVTESASTTGTTPTTTGTSPETTSASGPKDTPSATNKNGTAVETPASETSREKVYSGVGLPLTPKLTPASIIAGLFMIVFGLVYGMVGIRVRRLHTFFSITFLCSISVSVLIVYIMKPPIREAIYVGYVMAAILTGSIVGGLAVIFPEVTENLGCLLGGFCLAMWLLCLKPGGLIPIMFGKIVLISGLCIGLYILSFYPLTKPYTFIFALSFSGASITVLGADCFTRAGLKEMWIYIWDLNEKIFPIDTNTYPHTPGLRIELAVIVLVCIISILAQVKLWSIVRVRREAKRETKKRELEAVREIDEATGRRVEQVARRDRMRWELMFGNKKPTATEAVEGRESPSDGEETVVGELGGREKRPGLTLAGGETESAFSNGLSYTPGEVDEIQVVRPERRGITAEELLATPAELDGEVEEGSKFIPLPVMLQRSGNGVDTPISVSSIGAAVETASSWSTVTGVPLKPATRHEDDVDERDSSLAATLDDGLGSQSTRPSSARWSGSVDPQHHQTINLEEEMASRFGLSEGGGHRTSKDAPLVKSSVRSSGGSVGTPLEPVEEGIESTSRAAARLKLDGVIGGAARRERSSSTSSSSSNTPLSLPLKPPPPSLQRSGLVSPSSVHLPPQSSKIVKTYRTNEWAKHLSHAEKPALDDLTAKHASSSSTGSSSSTPTHLDLADFQLSSTSAPYQRSSHRSSATRRRSTSILSTPRPRPPSRSSTPANGLSIATDLPSPTSPATHTPTSPADVLPTSGTLLAKRESMLLVSPIMSNFDSAGVLRTTRSPSPGPNAAFSTDPFRHSRSASRLSMPVSSTTSLNPYQTPRSPPPPDRAAGALSPVHRLSSPVHRVSSPPTSTSRISSPSMNKPSRDDLLRSWRDSLRADEGVRMQRAVVERRRSEMVLGREREKEKEREKKVWGLRGEMGREEMMRRPEMMELHRERLRRMQREADKAANPGRA